MAFFAGSALADGPFFGEPPGENQPWAVHDWNRPQPPVVVPGERPGDPPSDAIVLFDGTEASLEKWVYERPAEKREQDWIVVDGAMQSMRGAGDLLSVEEFGDCQLHIEWLAPVEISGQGQGRGNSGVFFMGMVEVQILDNYQNPTYADGTVGSVYGVRPPAVNALRPSGEWQSYDIIFRRPIVRDGVVLDPGSLTVLKNGVVVQDSTPLEGGGGWKARKPMNRVFPEKGPLKLQDHGNPVRCRRDHSMGAPMVSSARRSRSPSGQRPGRHFVVTRRRCEVWLGRFVCSNPSSMNTMERPRLKPKDLWQPI